MTEFPKTNLNRVKRIPKRASYDKTVIYPIIDAALICHVGFVQEGLPFVIPMIHARLNDTLYLHGSTASRLLKQVKGNPLCVSITLLDGIVFARSAFHHSMNYRSAVLFGNGRLIESDGEKYKALQLLSEQIAKGRWEEARKPNEKELEVTSVIAVAIESASAKVRSGPPIDEEEDYGLPIWAGVLPIDPKPGHPIPDPRLTEGIAPPKYIADYKRPSDRS
ncbi:MAG: pyridoxamine 5'-phosphate oxidase family protein [Candidatus Manganitrophaceae bacterium]